jgi:drug/metabolite transporter (DMT)-like permease
LLALGLYALKTSHGARLSAGRALRYGLMGLFGYGLYSTSLNQSFRAFNAASEASVLNYTWPLFTVVFTQGIFRRERQRPGVRLVEALGTLVGFGAVVVLTTQGRLSSLNLANPAGVAWGLCAGASYGLFSAYSSTVPEREHSLFLLAAIATSWVLLLPLSYTERALLSELSWASVALALVQGGLLNGVGYITWTRANRLAREQGISISSVASLTFLLPIIALVWITLFLGETAIWRPYFVVSLAMVVLGSLLCQRAEQIVTALGGKAATVPE